MKFWTFKEDEVIFDGEFKNKQQAFKFAEERFIENCELYGVYKNGQCCEKEIELIQYEWNRKTDECNVVQRENATMVYECYHGDLKEHGTWYIGGGGAL